MQSLAWLKQLGAKLNMTEQIWWVPLTKFQAYLQYTYLQMTALGPELFSPDLAFIKFTESGLKFYHIFELGKFSKFQERLPYQFHVTDSFIVRFI
jgi:hypothetical protein